MKRATHQGRCQICDRMQKLPDDLLAKHGYRVTDRGNYGYFAGVCTGSGHLPFELDCEKTKEEIIRATTHHATLVKTEASRRDKADPSDVMVWHRYNSFRMYANARLILNHGGIRYILKSDKENVPHNFVGIFVGAELNLAAQRLNNGYADHIKYEAQNMEHYIKFQQKRVAEWKIQPLKKV